MNKAKVIRWVKWGLLLALILPPLKMAFEVSRTPSFDGGKAYVNFSPDGKYRGAVVYIAEQHRTGWVRSGMGLTNDASDILYLLTNPNGDEAYAIMPMDRDWTSTGRGTIWECGERRDEVCTGLLMGFWHEAQLPVSSWQQLHAWLTVRLKDLQDAEFAEVVVR